MTSSGMGIIRHSAVEVLSSLGSSMEGLSADEAAQRLAEFGPNRIEAVARTPLWLMLLQEFRHFFAMVLWIAALLAFVAAWFSPGEGMMELGVAIVGVILVNGFFSFWQAYRAEQALTALLQLLPQQVDVLRDGAETQLPVTELVPGDIVLLAEGAKVPADCRLIESWGLRVNLATLTGESVPKARDAQPDAGGDPLSAHNLLLAG